MVCERKTMKGPAVRQVKREKDPQLEDVLPLHVRGKTRMVSRVKINSVADLRRIYTPGVATVSPVFSVRRSGISTVEA